MRVGTLPRFRWENGEQQTKNKTFHFTFGRQVLVNYWTNLYFCWLLSIFASESRERAYTHWFLQFRAFPSIRPKNIEKNEAGYSQKNESIIFLSTCQIISVVAGSIRIRLFLGSGYLFRQNCQSLQILNFNRIHHVSKQLSVCVKKSTSFLWQLIYVDWVKWYTIPGALLNFCVRGCVGESL